MTKTEKETFTKISIKQFYNELLQNAVNTRYISATSDFTYLYLPIHELKMSPFDTPLVKVVDKNDNVVCYLLENIELLKTSQEIQNTVALTEGINYVSNVSDRNNPNTSNLKCQDPNYTFKYKKERIATPLEYSLIKEQELIQIQIDTLNEKLKQMIFEVLGEPLTAENKRVAENLLRNTKEAKKLQELRHTKRQNLNDFINFYNYNYNDYHIINERLITI